MPRPRTPQALAEASGASGKNPQRFRDRSTPKVRPLGKPPKRLTEVQVEAWNELAEDMPWLSRSDRSFVEMTAKLKARMVTDPDMGVNALAQLRMCLSSLGGSPSDVSKVGVQDDEGDDPAAEFIQ